MINLWLNSGPDNNSYVKAKVDKIDFLWNNLSELESLMCSANESAS